MKRHILYLAMLALGTAATGCSDDDTAKEGRTEPTTVESISIRTQMAEVSRAQTGDDDPTMGPASTRAGHTMTVTLGSGSERMQATYEYDGGKWIPAGEAVVFPDNKRQPVGIILRKEGTAIQDGTAQGLIDADQLGWDNPAQVPLREMANVPMRHLKTMVEFELGTIAATALTVDGLKACHVGNGNKWQAIIEPSTPGFRVSVTVNNTVSTTEVSAAASPTDGVFLADYRYTVPLVLNGSELTLGTIGVGSWDEGAGGTAQGMTPTHYRIEGLENRTIEVYLAGSDSPTQITLDAKGEAMQQAGVPVGIVARIACDGTQYEIGREESSQISLRIVDGKVAFREADDKGFIPVNTIAELKMIDLDDASRGRKYLQQGNIDLLDAEWTPISKLEGIYDGGNFTVARLRVSLGNGNAGLFAANGGTIRNVVIASASALRGQWHAGMVCGENTGTIERCTNRASVTDGGSNTLGGICGYNNNGTISECLNTGTLTIDATVPSDGTGGIVGYCAGWSLKQLIQEGLGGIPGKIVWYGEAMAEVPTLGAMIERIEKIMGTAIEENMLAEEKKHRCCGHLCETTVSARAKIFAGSPDSPLGRTITIFPHTGFGPEDLEKAYAEYPADTVVANISRPLPDSRLVEKARELGMNFVAGSSHAMEIFENGVPLAFALKYQLPDLEVLIFRERMVSIPIEMVGTEELRDYGSRMARGYLPRPKA